MSLISLLDDIPGRLYAVGDIHGCAGELYALLEHLEKIEKLNQSDTVIFIGDYIDRGPHSRVVIEILVRFHEQYPRTRFLKGNHEEMLLNFLDEKTSDMGVMYSYNGGNQFFRSYGLPTVEPIDLLFKKLPKTHINFLQNLELGIETPQYIFVHAGIKPNLPLNEQSADDILWIRDEFLSMPHNLGKTVIFGHTPLPAILVQMPYRIGIDTGVVFGMTLSCIELPTLRTFEVRRGGSNVEVFTSIPT